MLDGKAVEVSFSDKAVVKVVLVSSFVGFEFVQAANKVDKIIKDKKIDNIFFIKNTPVFWDKGRRTLSTDFKSLLSFAQKLNLSFTAGLPTYDIALHKKPPSQFPNGIWLFFIKYGNGCCSRFTLDSLLIFSSKEP